VVYGIIKNHNGSVRADSRPGEGAVFHIYLPCLEETKPVREEPPKAVIPRGKEKILFVDDEKDLAELAQISLTDLGYHVTICSDSREALNIFQSDPDGFDLVITDMTMPHLSGGELAQQLLKLRPGQSIILCTGYSSYISAEKAVALGIKAFLLKPVSRQDLAVAVRKALDENHIV
jgi:DNA-binding NtrC family response regulator